MNEQVKGSTMYERFSAVAELNKVPGFDPLRFARRVTQNGGTKLQLDLKYKKLWFRLRYPQGRIKVTPLKITEQLAIIEAKVFFDRGDTVPAASFVAQRYAKDTPGGLYIESAQHMAADTALDDAGFGVQLISAEEQRPVQAPAVETAPVDLPVAPPQAVATAAPPIAAQPIATATQEPQMARTMPAQPVPVEETAMPQESAPVAEETPVTPAVELSAAQTPVEEMPAEPAPIAEATVTTPPAVEQAAVIEDTPQTPPAFEMAPSTVETVMEEVPAASDAGEVRYTADMPVDEICALMTLDEARNIIVDVGTCKGNTLAWVSERRAASLKWYLNGYQGDNNLLRAGAKLLLESIAMDKAS